jgi:hypothetical protein
MPGNNGNGFKPGQSGNPGGRPAILKEVQELARNCTTEAVETLREIMRNKKAPAQARVAASSAMLDRGWGKPLQAVDLNHGTKDPVSEILDEVNGRTRGLPSAGVTTQ